MKLDRVIAVRNTKTVYRDGDRCIKVFCDGYSAPDVLQEALNQARAESCGICVPTVWEVTRIEGRWAIVSEFVKGKTMAQRMMEHPEKKEEYIEFLTTMQLQIHEKTCLSLPSMVGKIKEHLRQAELPETVRQQLLVRLSRMPEEQTLCHGDLMPSNIMMTAHDEPCVLDWSCASSGNRAADAACTYLLFLLHDDPAGADMYLHAFCRNSGIDWQTVREWTPFVSVARLAGGNQREQLFLRHFMETDTFWKSI